MRKLLSLMLVLSGLSVACSDDSKGDNPPADGDGATDETTDPVSGDGTEDGDDGITLPDAGSTGGDGDGTDTPEKYPECPRAELLPMLDADLESQVYTGAKPFSLEELQACQTKCQMDDSCYTEENCPGLDLFAECINVEISKCSFAEGGPCRTEYVNVNCCGVVNQCQDQTCFEGKCAEDLTVVRACQDQDCTLAGYRACFGDDEVGGGDGSDDADAGVGGDADGGAEGNSVVRPRVTASAVRRVLGL